jgi:hypothetical protein
MRRSSTTQHNGGHGSDRRGRPGRLSLALLAAVAVGLASGPAVAAQSGAEGPDVPVGADPRAGLRAEYATAPCDPNGPTTQDGQLATLLNGQLAAIMRGHMTAYRISCARMVVEAVEARGLPARAATIALTTVIVESSLDNVAETVDHDSLGLFQQRASWGSAANRLNPTWATHAFLNAMLEEYPDNSWMTAPIGEICQAVQISRYPSRYQPQAVDAQLIVNALWSPRDAVGVFRPASGTWFRWGTEAFGPYGQEGDVPLVGDWDGDGDDEPGVYRPGERRWYRYGQDPVENYGEPGDIPIVGNWDADPQDEVGVFRPGERRWYRMGATAVENYGEPGDIPIVGNWDADPQDEVGVFRPGERRWYRMGATAVENYGEPGDIPIVGHWRA